VYIPKAGDSTRTRPLDIPVMADRAMQALYLLALDPLAETTADPNSYGFRKERSTADAIAQCHTVLARKGGARLRVEDSGEHDITVRGDDLEERSCEPL